MNVSAISNGELYANSSSKYKEGQLRYAAGQTEVQAGVDDRNRRSAGDDLVDVAGIEVGARVGVEPGGLVVP